MADVCVSDEQAFNAAIRGEHHFVYAKIIKFYKTNQDT